MKKYFGKILVNFLGWADGLEGRVENIVLVENAELQRFIRRGQSNEHAAALCREKQRYAG